jgi:hypothetical protein
MTHRSNADNALAYGDSKTLLSSSFFHKLAPHALRRLNREVDVPVPGAVLWHRTVLCVVF